MKILNKLIILNIIILLTGLLYNCKPKEQIIKYETIHDTSYVEVLRDTLIKIPGDTIRAIQIVPDTFYIVNETPKQKITITKYKDGRLEYESICKEQEIKAQIKEIHSKVSDKTTITIGKGNKKISFWNKIMIIGGYIFYSLLIILLGYGVFKLLKKLKII